MKSPCSLHPVCLFSRCSEMLDLVAVLLSRTDVALLARAAVMQDGKLRVCLVLFLLIFLHVLFCSAFSYTCSAVLMS